MSVAISVPDGDNMYTLCVQVEQEQEEGAESVIQRDVDSALLIDLAAN